jgi:hypothetical protein
LSEQFWGESSNRCSPGFFPGNERLGRRWRFHQLGVYKAGITLNRAREYACHKSTCIGVRVHSAQEIKRLRQGIRQHRDSNRHELCWHHPAALWGLLPEKTDPIPVVPELSIPAPSWKQSIGMRLNSGSTAGAVLWFREFTREIATRFRDTEAMRRHREPE